MILEGDVSTERYVLPRRHVLQGKDCHGNPRVGAMGEQGWAQWTRGVISRRPFITSGIVIFPAFITSGILVFPDFRLRRAMFVTFLRVHSELCSYDALEKRLTY